MKYCINIEVRSKQGCGSGSGSGSGSCGSANFFSEAEARKFWRVEAEAEARKFQNPELEKILTTCFKDHFQSR